MNWDRVEGNWTEFKGKVQQKWGKLTNDDLEVVKGKRTELSGRLQQRYSYAKDQAEREIDTWTEGYALTLSRVFDFLSAQIKEPGGSAGFLLLSNDRVTQRQRQAAAEFLQSPLHPARNGVSRSGGL